MNISLIKFFNVALPEATTYDFVKVNEIANKMGYLVHPDVCTQSVMEFLEDQQTNYNATFYKTWEDVVSRSRYQIWFDQCLHYVLAAANNFEGDTWKPNDELGFVPAFETYKVILPITYDDLYERCLKMVCSGAALKNDTVKVLTEFMVEYLTRKSDATNTPMKELINIDSIKNREAQVILCKELGVVPNNKNLLFNYIIYVTTGESMVIKNAKMVKRIKMSTNKFDFSTLDDTAMKSLASIFNRHKSLFLAFKHDICTKEITYWKREKYYYRGKSCSRAIKANRVVVSKSASAAAPYINKLNKMADVYHAPMVGGFWQTLFAQPKSIIEIAEKATTLSPYKKVALMQACLERMSASNTNMYLIRNGKTFIRRDKAMTADANYVLAVYDVLRSSLVEDLKANSIKRTVIGVDENGKDIISETKTVVRTINGVSIALPSSEKTFVGNYPFGTTIKMSDSNYIGCYWRGEWGTDDFDLSMIGHDGKIGWDANFYSEHAIFSGDMRQASPEATEVIYMPHTPVEGLIKVNRFPSRDNLPEDSKFRIFVGREHIKKLTESYMVDPNGVILDFDVPVSNKVADYTIGYVSNNDITLMAIGGGTNITASFGQNESEMLNIFARKRAFFVKAEELLAEAGYEIVDDTYTGTVDIDYKNLTKDSIINIMAPVK